VGCFVEAEVKQLCNQAVIMGLLNLLWAGISFLQTKLFGLYFDKTNNKKSCHKIQQLFS
jgi:hypothetical protein